MKVFVRRYLVIGVLSVLIFGCKERFEPELKDVNTKLLVVEGMISIGNEPTVIKLSRTTPAAQKNNNMQAEVGAQVQIEASNNQTYTLTETSPGTYKSAVLNLNPQNKYRLKITSKGTQYATDFLEAKVTPPVEEISWEVKNNGVQIYVSTKDPSNNSRYYRWDFEDTWIFTANYQSNLIWENGAIRSRNFNTEDIYKCWATANSNSIVVGSSANLAEDVIYKQPLIFIPGTSEKFTEKYSILVKQYALTKEAFDFWESLRKNTENLGSIFDAQPSQLTGNIRNLNNMAEPVLGYISVGSVQTKRIFIAEIELPSWAPQRSIICNEPGEITVSDAPIFSNKYYMPLGEILNDSGLLIGYRWSTRECADCTLRGTNKKPDFWQ